MILGNPRKSVSDIYSDITGRAEGTGYCEGLALHTANRNLDLCNTRFDVPVGDVDPQGDIKRGTRGHHCLKLALPLL